MKPIEELLKNLARAEVLEFGLVTNRLPSVNIGGRFEPVDDEAPTTEALLQMLSAMGGKRFIESLSDKPVQWTTRLDGVGVIAVAAILRKDVVQARFTVAKRDTGNSVPSAPAARAPTTPAAAQRAGGERPVAAAAAPAPQALATGPHLAVASPPSPPVRAAGSAANPGSPSGAARRV